MSHRLVSVLFVAASLISNAEAQTGTQDQMSPAGNASFNGDASSLIWQQEVQSGLAGILEGFSLTLTGNVGSQLNVGVRLGSGWNTTPVLFSAVLTKASAASEVIFVDCSGAGISLGVGTPFVIEMNGNSTATWMTGSYVAPPGTPLYAPLLYLSGPGCFADCGWRIGFTTYVLTVAPPIGYCTPKVNSLGCLPAITFSGSPSSFAPSGFTVSATQVRNNKSGLLIYTSAGQSATPFQGGTLCLRVPVRRSIPLNSGGSPAPASDCSGIYSIDVNAFSRSMMGGHPAAFLSNSGTVIDCQFWGPDPGFPAPNNTTLSAGVEFTIP